MADVAPRTASSTLCNSPGLFCLGMRPVALVEHAQKLPEPTLTRFRALRLIQGVDDPKPLLRAEVLEFFLRSWARVESAIEVIRNSRSRLAEICSVPATVSFCTLDLLEARGAHPSLRGKPLDLVTVYPRPSAARAARRESLEKIELVETLATTVDPSEAKCQVEYIRVTNAFDSGPFLGDLDPNALRPRVVSLEPTLPGGSVRKRDPLQIVSHSQWDATFADEAPEERDLTGPHDSWSVEGFLTLAQVAAAGACRVSLSPSVSVGRRTRESELLLTVSLWRSSNA